LRNATSTDPLGAGTIVDKQISPALEALRQRLEALGRERDQLKSGVDNARALVAAIEASRVKADAALVECRQKIAGAPGLRASVTEAQIAELQEWLKTLANTQAQGHWTAFGKGLERWNALAAEYKTVQDAALAANEAPLETLAETHGRLTALQAKARARGALDSPALAGIAAQAAQLFAHPPVALATVTKLVNDYERALNETIKP
jgi:chromosome segregation ATPase